jgi:SNF2 family DNA or RNA helicase
MTQASTQEVHNNADFLGSPILSGLPHTAISKTSSPPTAVGPETLVSTALAIWCENEADIQARQRETETTIYNPSISFHTDFDSQSPFHTPHISQVSVRGSPEETDEKLSQYGGGLGTFSQRSKTSANISAEEAGFEVDSDKKGQLQSAPDRLIEEESLFVSGYADGDPSQLGDLYSYQHQFKSGDSISEGNNVLQVAEDKIIINGLEAAGKGDVGVSVKPQKKKRPKTGPRPKSSKEWFAKRSKDSLQSLPQISGLKRKRSKKEPESDSARHGKRKKSKKSTVDKSTKKKGRNKKSKKVMTAMFENLRHSNAIEARIALGDLPEADPIIAKTKGDQFEQILRGIPKDADKRSIASDKRKLEEATRSFGYGNCVANDGKWLVKGMKTSLHPHQLVGTSWMLRREFSDGGPYGGILADEMGMGKTLQTLACIVSNRPTDEDLDTYNRTTLIVVPAAAISQWEDEIRKHADGKYIHGVLHYKKSKGLPVEVLGHMGVM